MSKVNACLKRSFIILTCLIGVVSALTLGFTLFGHGYYHSADDVEGLIVLIKVMYALATATLLLTTIGVYGAAKDKSLPLIIFSIGKSLIILFVAIIFVAILIFRKQLLEFVKQQHLLNWLTPLDTTNGTDLEVLHEIQHVLRCCGVEKGYQDWGSHIHKTCICTEDVTECIAAPFNNGLYENNTSQTIMIYKPPCLPVLIDYIGDALQVFIAILATVEIFWFSSLLLAIMILVRLRRKVDVPPVYYSAEAKAGNYASLGENEIE